MQREGRGQQLPVSNKICDSKYNGKCLINTTPYCRKRQSRRGVKGHDKFHLLFYGFLFSCFAEQQIAAFFVPCAACSIIVGKFKSKIVSIRKQTTCKITHTDESSRKGEGEMRLKILHTFFCRLLFSSIAANVALTSTAPVADKSYRIVKIKLPKKHTHTPD